VLLVPVLPVAAQLPETREEIATGRPGVTQPFYLVRPAGPPVASLILFPGGEGVVGFTGAPPFPRGGNFLVRNRQRFAEHGFLVAVVDVPSDLAAGYGHFRIAAEHARDIGAVAAALRRHADVPVWAVGTSRGTVSAANAAWRLGGAGIDGLVLSSTVSRRPNHTPLSVWEGGLTRVTVPTLVVAHESDACESTPPGDARGLAAAVKAARTGVLFFTGGASGGTRTLSCGAFVAHGFGGLDEDVVQAIAAWIKATPAPGPRD